MTNFQQPALKIVGDKHKLSLMWLFRKLPPLLLVSCFLLEASPGCGQSYSASQASSPAPAVAPPALSADKGHLSFTPGQPDNKQEDSSSQSNSSLSSIPEPVGATDLTAGNTEGKSSGSLMQAPEITDTSASAKPNESNANTQSMSNPPASDMVAADSTSLAQAQKTGFAPAAASRTIPISVGTVEVRKPFKVFVHEELIRNLSFRDTPVREVIAELSRRGGINIFLDKSVGGTITGDIKDVTLNEAMDIVLAAVSLQSRILDNNMVVIGSSQAMVRLGLNRTSARAFKLSYAHPYDVANLLYASVFNKGYLNDFNTATSSRFITTDRAGHRKELQETPGGSLVPGQGQARSSTNENSEEDHNSADESREVTRPDTSRMVRGITRVQVQEGVGYNNAATDPGSQQIRTGKEMNTDYSVEQNGGGAIILPDVTNRQVVVIGTPDDLNLAEEAIRLIDRRPRMIHVQASLIELSNQAIRQIGANLALQGAGASTSILGNASVPLVNSLPGLPGQTATIPFTGVLGSFLPPTGVTAGQVTSSPAASSGFNFLTLNGAAGGKANIATFPTGLNVSLNLLLQTQKAKILANPSVVVSDNTEALITIANEVLHKVTSTVSLGVVSTNIELTKAGIFLNVLPRVAEDGFIVMRMRPQVSAPFGAPILLANNTVEVQLLSIREVMTQEVRIKDGQTLVIGGLFSENEAIQISKVPYLAEAPILGALFRNTLKGRNRTELLLLLTPKIVEEEPALSGPAGNPAPTM